MQMLKLYLLLLFANSLFAQTTLPLPTPRIFLKSCQCFEQHPEVSVTVDNYYKIISGGAYVYWEFEDISPGAFIVSSYPSDDLKTWYAKAKDHYFPQSSTIIAYAVAIYDPDNNFDVSLFKSGWSDRVQHPTASISVPFNYALTGGGARIDYGIGEGNLLSASYPSSQTTWTVNGKDHYYRSPATIMAFAIGIKPLKQYSVYSFSTNLNSITSSPRRQNYVRLNHDCPFPTGGGAIVTYSSYGAMLTASYPLQRNINNLSLSGWAAESKDHIKEDYNTLTVYTICVHVV